MGKSDVFEDVVICMTGAMGMTRNELTSLIKKNGGTVSASVTRKTTHLVSAQGEAGTEKYSKAEDEGLPIVNEDWIHDSIEEGKLKDIADYALSDAPASPKKKAPAKKAPAKKATSKRKRGDDDDEEEEEEEEEDEEKEVPDTKEKPAKMQKVMMKGRAPVDEDSGYVMSGQIYCDADIWSATLNQTDVKAGVLGHNKFYKIQLIDTGGKYVVFTKWGRVGAKGQKATEACGSSIEKAKGVFCKKFKEKTKNEWSNRANFKAQKGKYTLVDVNYGDDDEEEEEEEEEEEKKPKKEGVSKLDKKVQSLMQLISNKSLMVDTMKLFEIDLKKMPLGKLSKKQLQNGYSVLKRIQAVLDGEEDDDDVDDLSSEFYSLIPHDFGRQRPPSIDTKVKLEKKLDMMNALDDMEVASKLLAGAEKSSEHPIDAAYHSLKTELVPLDHKSDTFKMILEYIQNSHAPTHSGYTLELEDVFEVKREGEKERFTAGMDNHRLLWHGSRITNFMGILSTGLRIAPPEAPVTGYMFGKGVYFADSVSKSANYCFANHSNNNGILLLSDVALGNMRERYQADFVSDLPNDKHHSTFGVGKMAPDPKGNKTIDGNISVPMGKLVPQQGFSKPLSLQYNEFIVYDVKQINIRYLLKTKFHYK